LRRGSSFFTLFILSTFVVSVVSLKNLTGNASTNQPVVSKVASAPNNTPEPSLPVFKPNKELPRSKIYDINKKINQEALRQKNAKLEKVELMTFEESYQRLGKEAKLNPQISPERLVWVVHIHHPQGFTTRAGIIKNALAVGIYDAETGEILSTSITSLNK
jgi:hypothetical protein